MGLIDITPVMTSDTTPNPCVVSASSSFNGNYPAWNAFDNKTSIASNDGWVSISTQAPHWLQINFNKPTKIHAYEITVRGATDGNPPKDWILKGSSDGLVWDDIDTQTNQFVGFTPLEKKLYVCKESSYSYYRLYINSFNGSTYTCIGQLRFLQEDSLQEYVSHTKAFHAQTLPMNTTTSILAKTNDTREGLLGMANDPENYGDLYVVGKDGRSHLTKSGIKSEVIFEGEQSGVGKISLSKNINDYKYIAIENGSLAVNRKVSLYTPEQLSSNVENERRCDVSGFVYDSTGNCAGIMWINVTNGNTLNIVEIRSGNIPKITKIIGIY